MQNNFFYTYLSKTSTLTTNLYGHTIDNQSETTSDVNTLSPKIASNFDAQPMDIDPKLASNVNSKPTSHL